MYICFRAVELADSVIRSTGRKVEKENMNGNANDRCREFYIEHDSIPLHAKLDFPVKVSAQDVEDGRKCPLVIVQHGFTGHMEERHIIGVQRALNEAGFATLRTELYGHGKSGGTFRDHTLFKWLSEMLTIVDYAKNLDFVSDLFLCGHSQGGLLMMLTGAMERDAVRAILALSPAVMIPEEARRGVFLGNTFDPRHVPDMLVREDGSLLSGNCVRAAQLIRVEPAIEAFHKSVLIIHGEEDEAVPLRSALDAASRYEDVRMVVIPGDNHCYDNHLDRVKAEIREFMKRFA